MLIYKEAYYNDIEGVAYELSEHRQQLHYVSKIVKSKVYVDKPMMIDKISEVIDTFAKDTVYDKFFGFSEAEVKTLCETFGMPLFSVC